MVERNIYEILASMPGALRGRPSSKGIRVMQRDKIVIKQDEDVLLHRINDDGMFDVYCLGCGHYIGSTYEDYVNKYPKKWGERRVQMVNQHPCTAAHDEVAVTKERK